MWLETDVLNGGSVDDQLLLSDHILMRFIRILFFLLFFPSNQLKVLAYVM